MHRPSLDLCGIWRFQPDPGDEGERAGYPQPTHDIRLWREARLPATLEDCHPGLEAYEGAAWFRRTMTVPADWKGRRLLLRFEGANVHTRAWVNGTLVGTNEDGFLPFEFVVQDPIRCGEENTLVVRVDNERRAGEVPGLQRGWRTFGGILREVTLVATDPLYLDRVRTAAVPIPGGGQLSVEIEVCNERGELVLAEVSGRVLDDARETLAELATVGVNLAAGQSRSLTLRTVVPAARPWSPAEPRLYRVEVELALAGATIDSRHVRVGFRTIETRGTTLLLNGEPIYLTGFNRHEDSPRTGAATDLETARRDLLEMQAAGANFVRLCHYPHHSGELDLCDELGLLAMGEIPLYWWDGEAEGEEACARKLAAARRQLETMVRRDVNHPSLVFWSVSNETEENRPEVIAGNRQLVQRAKALDLTRLAVHVSNHWRHPPRDEEAQFEADDVLCVNGYPGLDRRGYGGEIDYDLAQATEIWRERLSALHERYPGKPILVTEYGYASLQGVRGSGFGEDTQAEALEREFAGMDAPYVCGATIWCWADHPWPAATFSFCSYLGISPYGVVTRERKKLAAYHTVRRLYRQRQGLAEPPQRRPGAPGPSGTPVYMIRAHLRDIPQVPFPEGFAVRPIRPGEGGLWEDIWRDAEEYAPFGPGLFESEFGGDRQAADYRCYLIVDHRDVAVGTISAWYHRTFKGQDHGVIHWVAVRPAYQGRGLGRAGMSYALNQLARWHTRAMLATQTRRLPAIKVYLDFGFRPDLEPEGALEAWREVKAGLDHPGLDEIQ